MLKVPNRRLSAATRTALDSYQRVVDQAGGYAQRVAKAKIAFKRRNTQTSAAFVEVRATLDRMCCGERRCMYCEDSAADEVEHFKPKDLYPELVFAWRNYLYACGPCNSPKNNQFAVIDARSALVEVGRKPKAPVVPPAKGAAALIDPRRENPLEFMMLDLRDTFLFTPNAARGSVDYLRADYTIAVLRLNDRDFLPRARKCAFGSYRARLREYFDHRNAGASMVELRRYRDGIRRMPHPTVWAEMVRQHASIPVLAALFAAAPEALEF